MLCGFRMLLHLASSLSGLKWSARNPLAIPSCCVCPYIATLVLSYLFHPALPHLSIPSTLFVVSYFPDGCRYLLNWYILSQIIRVPFGTRMIWNPLFLLSQSPLTSFHLSSVVISLYFSNCFCTLSDSSLPFFFNSSQVHLFVTVLFLLGEF